MITANVFNLPEYRRANKMNTETEIISGNCVAIAVDDISGGGGVRKPLGTKLFWCFPQLWVHVGRHEIGSYACALTTIC